MLSLFLVMLMFGTVLPMAQHLHHSAHVKKERFTAYETMHEGAKEMKAGGSHKGQRQVDGIVYEWEMADTLCVSYLNYKGQVKTLCLD